MKKNTKNGMQIICKSEAEMKYYEKLCKKAGFNKISDCMWAKVYNKNGEDLVLNREY